MRDGLFSADHQSHFDNILLDIHVLHHFFFLRFSRPKIFIHMYVIFLFWIILICIQIREITRIELSQSVAVYFR